MHLIYVLYYPLHCFAKDTENCAIAKQSDIFTSISNEQLLNRFVVDVFSASIAALVADGGDAWINPS